MRRILDILQLKLHGECFVVFLCRVVRWQWFILDYYIGAWGRGMSIVVIFFVPELNRASRQA